MCLQVCKYVSIDAALGGIEMKEEFTDVLSYKSEFCCFQA